MITKKSFTLTAGVFLLGLPLAYARPESYDGYVKTETPSPPLSLSQLNTHGVYTGAAPTVTGALTASVIGTSIPKRPAPPSATTYPADGQLHAPQPIPYAPGGGLGTNGTEPVYRPQSDFDYESLTLGLYQEYLELDLFQYGLQRFSEADFLAAGLTAADRRLIQFMAEQELGHIAALTNIIGSSAAKSCSYNYPFETVFEFFDFSQKITRLGESGVYGFLPHLNSRESAQVLLQIITTEARQQMIFRQIEGLFPVPVWFEVGIPQSWAWSILSPYIASCPVNQTRVAWQNFPPLTILNQVNPISANGTSSGNHVHPGANIANSTWAVDPCYKTTCPPYFNSNRTTLSGPGRNLTLIWESPGKPIGPNNSYVTTTSASGPAAYVAWLSQLNVTYTPLNDVHPIIGGNSSNTTSTASSGVVQLYTGTTVQPDVQSYIGNPAVNGTMFIAVTDKNPYVTPFNVSMLNPHVVAGPAMYQAS